MVGLLTTESMLVISDAERIYLLNSFAKSKTTECSMQVASFIIENDAVLFPDALEKLFLAFVKSYTVLICVSLTIVRGAYCDRRCRDVNLLVGWSRL